MKMQFKIQNVKQLLAIHTLIQSNEIASNRFFTKEIKVTLDLLKFYIILLFPLSHLQAKLQNILILLMNLMKLSSLSVSLKIK